MNEMKDTGKFLTWVAMLATLVLTFSAEYDLGRAVGWSREVAVAFPIALDAYLIAAVRKRREVVVTVFAAMAVNVTSHLVNSHASGVNTAVTVAVSAIPPLILWRIHALDGHEEKTQRPARTTEHQDVSEHPVFTRSDLHSYAKSLVTDSPVSLHRWDAIKGEVPPAKVRVNDSANADANAANTANTRVNTPLKTEILRLSKEGLGVRETAERVGCSAGYVSTVRRSVSASE